MLTAARVRHGMAPIGARDKSAHELAGGSERSKITNGSGLGYLPEEPYAGNTHVRICKTEAQWPSYATVLTKPLPSLVLGSATKLCEDYSFFLSRGAGISWPPCCRISSAASPFIPFTKLISESSPFTKNRVSDSGISSTFSCPAP
jgi:hypothetical protein